MTGNDTHITIEWDDRINCYVVRMRGRITLDMLADWKTKFDGLLDASSRPPRFSLLIDTGAHDFESVECLRFLREYLSNQSVLGTRLRRGAFVAPAPYVAPHVTSTAEAYFNDFHEAYRWIGDAINRRRETAGSV